MCQAAAASNKRYTHILLNDLNMNSNNKGWLGQCIMAVLKEQAISPSGLSKLHKKLIA